MTIASLILMTTQEKDDAEALSDESVIVEGREIDNPLSNNLGEGTLVGKWVASSHILVDPLYERWWDSMGLLPVRVLESEMLFIPQEI